MRLCFALCLFLLSSATLAARADSFTVYNLGGDDVTLMGIDAQGSVLLKQFNPCGGGFGNSNCYEEFTDGALTYEANVAPTNFVADNGTACGSPALTGAIAEGASVCDGGFQVFGNSDFEVREITPGSTPLGDFVLDGSDDVLSLNASGDMAVVDGSTDTVYEVVVSQVPEPASFALLLIGVLGLIAVMRRRPA